MRRIICFIFIGVLIFGLGCSRMTTIGKEGVADYQLRTEYINSHPDGYFNYHIHKGEIKRGMERDEVAASWGFPDVLLAGDNFNHQHWVYYTKGSDAGSVLIYTLDFLNDSLRDWDIEIKRFTGFGLDGDPDIFTGRDNISVFTKRRK